jgi:hypothetical protein
VIEDISHEWPPSDRIDLALEELRPDAQQVSRAHDSIYGIAHRRHRRRRVAVVASLPVAVLVFVAAVALHGRTAGPATTSTQPAAGSSSTTSVAGPTDPIVHLPPPTTVTRSAALDDLSRLAADALGMQVVDGSPIEYDDSNGSPTGFALSLSDSTTGTRGLISIGIVSADYPLEHLLPGMMGTLEGLPPGWSGGYTQLPTMTSVVVVRPGATSTFTFLRTEDVSPSALKDLTNAAVRVATESPLQPTSG